MNDDSKMTFLEHLEELRRRLIVSMVSILIGMIICWFFREEILAFLLEPLYLAWRQVDGLPEPKPLNFSSMLEPFIAYLKLSALGGLFLASPVVLFQIWRFVAPGLYPREKRLALPFVFVSTLLFVVGSLMAYKIVFPIGFRFFLDFASGREMMEIEATLTVAEWQASDDKKREAPPPKRAAVSVDAGHGEDQSDGGAKARDEAASPTLEARAGSKTKRAPPPAPSASVPATAEPDDGQSWYGDLLGRLLADECASFNASSATDESGALLTVHWHEARCGAVPDIIKLRRDGELLHVNWKRADPVRTGYTELVARDEAVTSGEHEYTLAVPRNPSENRLAPVLMVKDYLSLAVRILLAFGVIFELPIFISFLSIAGIVNYRQLISFSRYFLVLAVVIGAMLTPPDVITQILLALPLMVLYFVSVVVAYFLGPKAD